MRNQYKARRDILLAEFSRRDPGRKLQIQGADTGLHLLVRVCRKEEDELVSAAEANGVRVYGLSAYYQEGAAPKKSAKRFSALPPPGNCSGTLG